MVRGTAALVTAAALVACGGSGSSNGNVRVRYKIDGTVKHASVIYNTFDLMGGPTKNVPDAEVPFAVDVDAPRDIFFSVSARSSESGSLTCHIVFDGKEVATQTTATGQVDCQFGKP